MKLEKRIRAHRGTLLGILTVIMSIGNTLKEKTWFNGFRRLYIKKWLGERFGTYFVKSPG